MRVIIAGSRNFTDYLVLKSHMDYLLSDKTSVEIVCGGARGADLLGKKYAEERGFEVKMFPADWNLGKKAGYIRNKQMAEYATHLVAFWDFKSPGTKHMIDLAKTYGLNYRVIRV